MLLACFFFFFQAEDGIRDIGVTGVQTCALPIWSSGPTDRRGPCVPSRILHAGRGTRAGLRARRIGEARACRLGFFTPVAEPAPVFGPDGSARPVRAVSDSSRRSQIGRASCREKSVDLGGRRIIKKKKTKNVKMEDSEAV